MLRIRKLALVLSCVVLVSALPSLAQMELPVEWPVFCYDVEVTLTYPDGDTGRTSLSGVSIIHVESTGREKHGRLRLVGLEEELASFPARLDIDKDGILDLVESGDTLLTDSSILFSYGTLDLETGDFFLCARLRPEPVQVLESLGYEQPEIFFGMNGNLDLATGSFEGNVAGRIFYGPFHGVRFACLKIPRYKICRQAWGSMGLGNKCLSCTVTPSTVAHCWCSTDKWNVYYFHCDNEGIATITVSYETSGGVRKTYVQEIKCVK